MSHKHLREEGKTNATKNLPVVSKCLAIVLIPRTRKNSAGDELNNDEVDETIVDPTDGNVIQSSEAHKILPPAGYNGKELLQDFKIRNKTCYWNPSLVESIKSLEYKGFVEPFTILVTGADIHLENLRSAWGRRVLKAPAGFTIERIGDVNGIQMQVIPQTQFMPLPDALCNIIMDLNMRHIVATLEMILEKLTAWYKDMTVPSQQLVFDTLGSLIKERKVFHTGSGYFVVTPDTNRLQTSINTSYLPTNASWLPYHPMYVPVFQGQIGQQPPLLLSRAHMRSISCQVTTIEESSDEEAAKENDKGRDNKGGTLGKASKSNSQGKEDKKAHKAGKGDRVAAPESGEFKRIASFKVKGDKAKVVKEANLKSGVTNLEKEKEKTSIFFKLFSRKKKEKDKDRDRVLMPPPPPPPPLQPPVPPPTATANSTDGMSEGRESKEKEYATFSAQFPPPEWLWYQQQLEKQRRTETWVSQQTSKVISGSQLVKVVTTRPPTGVKVPIANSHNAAVTAKKLSSHQNQQAVEYMPMSIMTSHKEKRLDNIRQVYESDLAKPRPIRADNLYESFRNPSMKHRHHHHHHHRKSHNMDKIDDERKHSQRPSDYDVIDQDDVTPFHDSNVYHSVSALSPVAHLSDESTYAKLIDQPKLGPLHSTPRYEGQHDRMAYGVEGHEARDRIYGPPDHSHKRKSHRSRRRQHRVYSYYGQGDDISYEYKGHLPNKNSSRAQSRDSGVNCVGLGLIEDHKRKQLAPMYENTLGSNKCNQHQGKQPTQHHPSGNHVHFEITGAGGETSLNSLCVTDPVTNSVTYQSDVTNLGYNSVVYGSNVTDPVGGPSVMYHTIIDSNIETSGVPVPQNSLQSAFYDDSSIPLSPRNVITCKAEINTKAPLAADDSQSNPGSLVDVVGSPSARELSGASDGIIEVVAVEEPTDVHGSSDNEDNATAVQFGDRMKALGEAEDDYHENDDEDSGTDEDIGHKKGEGVKHRKSEQPPLFSEDRVCNDDFKQPNSVPATKRQEVSGGNSGKDNFVSDSGFSSPRNPEKPADNRAQISGQSNSASELSSGHNHHDNSGDTPHRQQSTTDSSAHHNSGETTGSDGHQTSSDVYMATGSEHLSGSANEHADSCNKGAASAQDNAQFNHMQKVVSRVKQSQSLNSIKSQHHIQQPQHYHNYYHHPPPPPPLPPPPPHHQQKQSHPMPAHHYQPAAKMITHPDVYNNNTSSTVYIDHSRPARVPLHPNAVLSNHKPHMGKSKHSERPHSVDLWRSTTPNELHKFEEEQLSKKYGANGEFEVMGVF